MHGNKNVSIETLRKQVSKLFFEVLTKKISIKEALAKFPKDCTDKTIIASWHALCHLEADEDLRKKDKMYLEVQDEYIEFIANTLSKGLELPKNIINSYYLFHQEALVPNSKSLKGIWQELKKFLCC